MLSVLPIDLIKVVKITAIGDGFMPSPELAGEAEDEEAD